MTRSELVAILADRFPQLLRRDADMAVTEILGGLSLALSNGRRAEIRGFGSFSINYQAPRMRRNPKTGELFQSMGKYTPHFKAGKALRDAVDFRDSQQMALKKVA